MNSVIPQLLEMIADIDSNSEFLAKMVPSAVAKLDQDRQLLVDTISEIERLREEVIKK